MSRFGWAVALFLLTGHASGLSFDGAKSANADSGINAYVKEATKEACDKFKGIAGANARDYAQVPAQ